VKTVRRFKSYEICKGVEDFRNVWKTAENAEIDLNRFHEGRFKTTCRSSECFMLVPSVKTKRCHQCQALWVVLSKRRKVRDAAVTTPEKHKPTMFLNTPQRLKRLEQRQKEIRRLRAEMQD